jgi:arginine decarboxylase
VIDFIPKRIFLTKGVGVHRDKLSSFELSLRNAGIEKCNLVSVSSILPPRCKMITRKEGLSLLKAGQIAFAVMARAETNEPNRLISAAVGVAVPKNPDLYGYLSEHHAYGMSARESGDYAEDLAASMLATTLGIDFDLDQAWDERKQVYKTSGHIIRTQHICRAAEGHKKGLWTSVMAAAILLLD